MIPKQWSAEVVELGDRIAKLRLTEAVMLTQYLEEIHGIKPAASSIYIQPPVLPPPQEMRPVQMEFTVVYEGLADPAKKITVIKTLREITGYGLKEAKDFAEQPPKTVRDNLNKVAADALADKLRDAGAKVTVK